MNGESWRHEQEDLDELNLWTEIGRRPRATDRERQLDRVSRAHKDIYNPPLPSVLLSIAPLIKSISDRPKTLVRLGERITEDVDSGLEQAMEYFVNVFGIKDELNLEIYDATKGDPYGRYYHDDDTIAIYLHPGSSVGDNLNTVAHEVYHAYQRRCVDPDSNRGREYAFNQKYYYDSDIDIEAYSKQRLEQEAFLLGNCVQTFYWAYYFDQHPKEVDHFHRRYLAWQNGHYDPRQSNEGIDEVGLRRAEKAYHHHRGIVRRLGDLALGMKERVENGK